MNVNSFYMGLSPLWLIMLNYSIFSNHPKNMFGMIICFSDWLFFAKIFAYNLKP